MMFGEYGEQSALVMNGNLLDISIQCSVQNPLGSPMFIIVMNDG